MNENAASRAIAMVRPSSERALTSAGAGGAKAKLACGNRSMLDCPSGVAANASAEAQSLQPLARVLAVRYAEQRRVEDDRDRQVTQVRDAQRRIDQLNERIEALRAIERSFARPSTPAAQTNGGRTGNGTSPAP